jgi:endo-1,4-beta-mannosidase
VLTGELLSSPFTLGVNYWPRRKAMYSWSNFDAEEVREEFSLIGEIGLNIVQLFLLWDLPPCQNARHERFFGLVQPDGSIKPHAKVIQEFAKTKPQVKSIPNLCKDQSRS